MNKKKDIGVIFRQERIASGIVNGIGAFITFFYLNVIDPAPKAEQSIKALNSVDSIIFVSLFAVLFFSGITWGNRQKKNFAKWYTFIETGEKSLAEVPQNIKRGVLLFPLRAAGIAAIMWLSASIIVAYITESARFFIGLLGWGGFIAVVLLYFVDDLLWRPVIPVFFPDGNLSEARVFHLPIFWKLLIMFLFTGILPPALLVNLTWQRAQMLLDAPNPDALLANLQILQIFILGASVVASLGFAFFVTRGIANPLEALRKAMERVQEDDFDAKVVVTTNDEVGYLGERFNQMIAELRQKEMLRNTNSLLRAQLEKIKELETALREQAIRDPLTGLFNRRYMEDAIRRELSRASRSKKPFSVVIIDLDSLKEINDKYGHVDGGDEALLLLSREIGALCREEDIFCRYAGDEFLVMLYNTSAKFAYERTLAWQKAVSRAKIVAGEREFGVTFSAGIAEFPTHASLAEKLVQKADKALYQAKEAGRNYVAICKE